MLKQIYSIQNCYLGRKNKNENIHKNEAQEIKWSKMYVKYKKNKHERTDFLVRIIELLRFLYST